MALLKRTPIRQFFSLVVTLLLFAAALTAQDSQRENALRARVEKFYSLLQLGQKLAAEQFLVEESREAFRSEPRSPFVGFEIDIVKFDPDGQSATVDVKMQVIGRMMPTPVNLTATTKWRIRDGEWFAVLGESEGGSLRELMSRKQSGLPLPENLKFVGSRWYFGFVKPGQIKTARFPFTNITKQSVTITAVLTGCDCLRLKTEKREYKPGESGEILIEFDPEGYSKDYVQSIVVRTDPGSVKTVLHVLGYLLVPGEVAPKLSQNPEP